MMVATSLCALTVFPFCCMALILGTEIPIRMPSMVITINNSIIVNAFVFRELAFGLNITGTYAEILDPFIAITKKQLLIIILTRGQPPQDKGSLLNFFNFNSSY